MKLNLNENLAYMLGVICGDGTLYIKEGKEYSLAISDKIKEFHEILKQLIAQEFKVTPKIYPVKERNAWYTVVRSKELIEILNKGFGISLGKDKTYRDGIPEQIKSADNKLILSHFAGWIDAEGSSKIKTFKTKYGIYKYPCITIELVNKRYLEDLYELSKKVEVPSTKPILMKRNYRKDQKPRYGISWNGFEKCKLLLQCMKHPKKKDLLSNKILSSGRPI